MVCHGTNKKGQPCKKPTKTDWCTLHFQQEGDGFIDDAKDFLKRAAKGALKYVQNAGADAIHRRIEAVRKGPRVDASARFKKFLEETEGHKIVKLQLGQKPILKPVHKVMDALSLGGFSKKQKELDYDDVFHNYLLVTLDNGKTLKLEKNETLVHKESVASDFENQLYDVPLKGKQLSIKEMIETASKGNTERFYKYRASSDNCQRFTRDMVEKNGLMPDDVTGTKRFHVQDADALSNSLLPGARSIPDAVTDLASVADRALYGDGLPYMQSPFRY